MPTLILKGRAFDGKELLRAAVLTIDADAGVITGFGERGSLEEGRGAKVIKRDDATILPGLIDAHVHFYSSKGEGVTSWASVPDTLAVLRAAHDLRTLLQAGFTAVRELGTKGGVHLAQAVEEGAVDGPTVVSCSRALSQTGGDDDPPGFPLGIAQGLASYTYFCDGPWSCRQAVRKVVRDGGSVVKLYASGAFSRGEKVKQNFTLEEIKAIVDESHRAGLKVAAHAYGEDALLSVIDAGVDSIEHGLGLTGRTAKAIAEKGIYYVPTLTAYMAAYTGQSRSSRAREEMVKRHFTYDMVAAKEHKVKVVAGSDIVGDSKRPHGRNYFEIVAEARYLGNRQALEAATSRAATCLDLPDRGSLRKGYRADVIVVEGNPVDDLESLAPENIIHVIKSGKLQG
ncbi:MAG: amidohydrolase family protein [Nitrososphaerales archaeon]